MRRMFYSRNTPGTVRRHKSRHSRHGLSHSMRSLESLEARIVLDARLLISEIVADNETGFVDEDDDRTDWIEIYNAGDQSANLQGWYLTDDVDDKTKWSFPATTLDAGEFLVVHASGKNRVDPAGPLHTNFQLRASGEYLALVHPDGHSIEDQYAPEFPPQHANIAFGLSQAILDTELVEPGASARWLVPKPENGGNLLGKAWTEVGFDDSTWNLGTNNIGFETLTGYEELIGTDVSEQITGSATTYVRTPFELESADSVFTLTLSMQYDDGYIAYLNGVAVAQRKAPDDPDWNSQAAGTRRDADAVVFEDVDLTAHTDLLRDGQNVLAIHALNANPSSNDFLMVPRLTALRLDAIRSLERRYIQHATPGEPNGDVTYSALVADIDIEGAHGFYDEPLDVHITGGTPGASIIYTTDGSAPAVDNGIVIPPNAPDVVPTATLRIEETTTIRVASFKDDLLPTKAQTLTYIFANDIASQDIQATLDAGFPERWGNRDPDYGIDPNVVGPNDLFDGLYTDQFATSLKSVPTLSIVMDLDDLFDADTGIYSNSEQSGRLWERPASVELIYPDGSDGFQIDAGIRVAGGFSRSASAKKSFRLEFRGDYGPTKLRFPILGDEAVDEFDSLVLRAGFNDAWVWTAESTHYLRDQWTRATQRLMGHPSSHGTRMHLYVNGRYWGLYNPVERPDASFSAAYVGGDQEEWDAINTDGVVDGTNEAWVELLSQVRAVRTDDQAASNEALLRILGRKADGTDDPNQETLLDVENYIDYMMLNFYIGNTDWPRKNFYVGRQRGPESTGFKFYSWDAERSLNDQEGADVNRDMTGVVEGVAAPYASLRRNDEFRLMFADQIQRHFFNGGLFYVDPENSQWDPAHPERNRPAARYSEMADQIELPLVAESARWGDARRTELAYTIGEWRQILDDMFTNWLPQRSAIVLEQFVKRGLYPELAAPRLSQHGGTIDGSMLLTIDAPGDIYYTLDGSDPRRSALEPGVTESGISERALRYDASVSIDQPTVLKARTYADGQWSALTEATFTTAPPPLRVTEIMYHPRAVEPESPFEDDDFEYIELLNISTTDTVDLEGIAFTAGVDFTFPALSLSPGQHVVVTRNQAAFEQRYGTTHLVAGQYGGTPDSPKLDNGGETLRLADPLGNVIQEFAFDDQWFPNTDGDGYSLTIVDAHADLNRWNVAEGWRSSMRIDGSPGSDDSADFNGDGLVDVIDVDQFCGGKRAGDMRFDLTHDGSLNQDDLARLIQGFLGTDFGDANLDGVFDSRDLLQVLESGQYEDNVANNSTWADGDWNCDAEFTTDDLVLALSTGKFSPGTVAASGPQTSLERQAVAAALSADELEPAKQQTTDEMAKQLQATGAARSIIGYAQDDVFTHEVERWTEYDFDTADQAAADLVESGLVPLNQTPHGLDGISDELQN